MTDIKVIFDAKVSTAHSTAVQLQETTEDGVNKKNDTDAVRFYGKTVPIIIFNGSPLHHSNISRYTLYYDAFQPYLRLVLYDYDGFIQFSNVPGMANYVTLMMLPHNDGAYKAIKLDFYIKNISYRGQYITCDCEQLIPELEKAYTQQLVFHFPDEGCKTDHSSGVSDVNNEITDCPLEPDEQPTTYELLHVIAEETELGFATTDNCAGVQDHRNRMMRKETYKDAIKKHVAFGGKDSDSLFDTWIDLYGYLTLINVPWVMSQKIDTNNLAIHNEAGFDQVDARLGENQLSDLMIRFISNERKLISTNIYVISYENMVDNNSIITSGSSNTYYEMSPTGVGTNNMTTTGIDTVENSVDGQDFVDAYRFDSVSYRGAEMGSEDDGNYPTNHQKQLHDKYFARLRAKRLKVRMGKPNFGFMRGTFISFYWYEYETIKKQNILLNYENAKGTNSSTEASKINPDITLDPHVIVPNPFVTGIYYIDGMIFEYDEDTNEFVQYLILIKKEDDNSMLSNAVNNSDNAPIKTVNA